MVYGRHRNGRIWLIVPCCLVWCLWREKNSKCLKIIFLISNKDVYSKTLPHAESHKAEKKITEKEAKKRKKRY